MYCDIIYGALDRLASREFVNDEIIIYESFEATSFLTYLDMGISRSLTKNQINSIGNKVKAEFIDSCKKITACYLYHLSTHWTYEHYSDWERGPHSYISNFKGCKIKPHKNTTLSHIGRLYNLFPEKIYISPHYEPYINAKNKEDLDLFLRCLTNEAIKSSLSYKSFRLMISAKNDSKWIWEVEKMLIPKEIIGIVTRVYIDSF